MSSIMTNVSAMTALKSLQATNKALESTQSRISTGFRVAEASDNAAYWSIATTMRSDNRALSTVQDSLGLGAGKVDTAYTGMNKAIEVVNEIKVKLVAAVGSSDDDKAKIQTEITALQAQLASNAAGATFSGSNWLSVDTTNATVAGTHDGASIVSSFNRSATGAISLGTIDIAVESIKLYDVAMNDADDAGILEAIRDETGARDAAATVAVAGTYLATDGFAVSTLTVVGFNDQQIEQMLAVTEGALSDMTDAATSLGSAKKRIDLQQDFTASMMDAIDRGVGQLVDADMNEESTRLQALQVQQQLGIQSLSIANSNAQQILSLFR
jgi:flagellin